MTSTTLHEQPASSSTLKQGYWLMGFNGYFLDHDLLHDRLSGRAIDLAAQQRSGITISSEPEKLHTRQSVSLRKHYSLPMPFPRLTCEPVADGLLTLRIDDRAVAFAAKMANFVTLEPNGRVEMDRTKAQLWEYFLPVSEALARVLGWLQSGTVLELVDEDRSIMPQAKINHSFKLRMGPHVIPIATNTIVLEQLAYMTLGETRFVGLSVSADRMLQFSCRRAA